MFLSLAFRLCNRLIEFTGWKTWFGLERRVKLGQQKPVAHSMVIANGKEPDAFSEDIS